MIFVTDALGKASYIGPEWKALTGQSPAQAVNFGWAAVVHAEDVDIVRKVVSDAVRAQSEFMVRYRLLRQIGGFVWVTAGAIPSYGPPGRTFLGFLGSITVLTDSPGEDLKAYGSLGPLHAERSTPGQKPASTLELAADHLIMAHSLLMQDGGKTALPALEAALHQIGLALAKAAQDGNDWQNLH